MFKWLSRKPVLLSNGNEHTGDLALKHSVVHIEQTVGNWVYGFIPGLRCYFTAKVHSVSSKNRSDPFRDKGINGGRISRLWISHNEEKRDPVVNFEMGQWLIEPKTAMERTVVSVLLDSWA